jgi:iron complex outermembrane receptor protein
MGEHGRRVRRPAALALPLAAALLLLLPSVPVAWATGQAPASASASADANASASVGVVDAGVDGDDGSPASAPPRPVAVSSPYVSVVRARPPRDIAGEDSSAASSVVLPAEDVRAGADLGALLTDVPGVNLTRRGGVGSFSTLSLRGSNPDEVRVYIDGVPINQAAGGAVDLSTLPIGDVERVEVYRGATPIAFGESALGGVVAISTRAPEKDGLTGQVAVGSFGTRVGDATGSLVAGPLRLYLGGHAIAATGDYPVEVVSGVPSPDRRQNNDLTQLDGTLRATLTLPGRRELRLGFLGFARDQGLPAEEIFRSLAARARTTRAILHAGYESRSDLGPSGRLRAVAFASSSRDRFSDPLAEIVGVPTRTDDLTRSLGFSVTGDKFVGGHLRLAGLIEARVETYRPRNDADPAMPAGYPANREVGTVGLEVDEWVAPADLHVIPSGRLEAARDVRSGRDETFGTNLPDTPATTRSWPVLRLGLLRPLGPDWALRASAGHYQRIPSFLELYGYDRGFIGNPTLRPERGTNLDVGFTLRHHGEAADEAEVNWSGAVFAARADDLISWETYSYRTRAENVSRARIMGGESELRARLGRLATTVQATLTDALDEGTLASRAGRQIAHHPRYQGYLRVEWRQPLPRAGATLTGYADADGTAGNYWTTSAYGALPPRLIGGLGVVVELPRWASRFGLSAYNLLDARVHDFPGYPLPGRSYLLTFAMDSTMRARAVPAEALPSTVPDPSSHPTVSNSSNAPQEIVP